MTVTLPLYGSGGRIFRTPAQKSPSLCLSIDLTSKRVGFVIDTSIPSGIAALTLWLYPTFNSNAFPSSINCPRYPTPFNDNVVWCPVVTPWILLCSNARTVPHIDLCSRVVLFVTTTTKSFRSGATFPKLSVSSILASNRESTVQAGTSEMNGGTATWRAPNGPVMVMVWKSDSRTAGPPRGWCRGVGLRYFVRTGGGGGVIERETFKGIVRRFPPTFEAWSGVLENCRMQWPGIRRGSIDTDKKSSPNFRKFTNFKAAQGRPTRFADGDIKWHQRRIELREYRSWY